MKNKTEKMRRIEAERGCSLEEIIRPQIEAGRSWAEVADELGVSRLTLRGWAKQHLNLRLVMRRSLEPVQPGRD